MEKTRKLWDGTIQITLTWSKIIALFVLVAAVMLDWKNGGSTVTMYSLPFIVFLITGKQYIESKNGK